MAAPDITAPVVGGKITAAGFGNQVDTAVASFASPPRCSVYNSGNISIGSGNGTMLTWDSEEYDTDTMHSTSSQTSRIVATTAGTYRISCVLEITMTSSSAQDVVARILKNAAGVVTGGTSLAQVSRLISNNAQVETVTITKTVVLAAADYVEIAVKRADGTAGCQVDTGLAISYLQATLVAYP